MTDNQEVMERRILNEKRRARDELGRMKEAMLKALQREKKALKQKLVTQNAQVQALMVREKEKMAAQKEKQQQQQQQQQVSRQQQQPHQTSTRSNSVSGANGNDNDSTAMPAW